MTQEVYTSKDGCYIEVVDTKTGFVKVYQSATTDNDPRWLTIGKDAKQRKDYYKSNGFVKVGSFKEAQ